MLLVKYEVGSVGERCTCQRCRRPGRVRRIKPVDSDSSYTYTVELCSICVEKHLLEARRWYLDGCHIPGYYGPADDERASTSQQAAAQAHRGERKYEFKPRKKPGRCYYCQHELEVGKRYLYIHKSSKEHGLSLCAECWDVLLMDILKEEEKGERSSSCRL